MSAATTFFRSPVHARPATATPAARQPLVQQATPSRLDRWIDRMVAWGENATHHHMGSWMQR
jgi:hypothetical protein